MKLSREFLIGVVVVVAIALLYLGINYLKGVNLFAKQQKFYAIYDNVAGLVPSNAVVLNGFKVGIVSEMRMHPSGDGRLVVEILLDNDDLTIPADTRLEIYDADLFGGKAIKLQLGDSSVMAVHKDTLSGSVDPGLTDIIKKELEPLKQKTSELFLGLDSVLTNLNAVFKSSSTKGIPDMFRSLQGTLENLENSSASLDNLLATNNQRITDILANVESISSNLKGNNASLTRAVTNFSSLSDTLARLQLASTMLKVDKAIGEFSTTMEKINQGTGTLGQLISNDSLHHELVSASHSLDLLLDDMRVHPKRYVQVSLIGRRDSERFSKSQLEQMRDEINELLKEREKEKAP
ncbi:MAG: MlaD family protein [Flavobacteriales bacterium]|jgi:phospholipid/cholesterol/gamma-HCH transport system substrate-binding protein